MEDMDDPEDVFEINDFTVVTELERFVVSIESVLQEWNVSGPRTAKSFAKGALQACEWKSKWEKIQFGDANHLRLTYFWPEYEEATTSIVRRGSKEDAHLTGACSEMLAADTDFCYKNNITAMFGVTEYLLLSPWDQVDDQIVTEDQRNTILSALRMAALSSECEVPMFLQYGHIDRQLFSGVAVNRAMITSFEGSHLRRAQSKHLHLSGLLSLFKEKVDCPISPLDANDIRTSVLFEHTFTESEKPLQIDTVEVDQVDINSVPIDSNTSVMSEFTLIATWPNMKEDMINENEVYTDLDSINAFNWSVAVNFSDGERQMSSALYRLLEFPRTQMGSDTASSLLGLSSSPALRAFGQLTDGASATTLRIGSGPSITNPSGLTMDEPLLPFDKPTLNRLLGVVFDEVYGDDECTGNPKGYFQDRKTPGVAVRTSPIREEKTKHSGSEEAENSNKTEEKTERERIMEQLRSVKAAPAKSLSSRFATLFIHSLNEHLYGPTAFAQIWIEFVKKLRHHYENNIDLPTMESVEYPDLSCSILHQKIEMLQCCIVARKKRHALYDKCSDFGNDEFFDAEEDMTPEENEKRIEKAATSNEPQGRLYQFGNVSYINNADKMVWVPITQDRAPMTEDMVEAHARYLASLGEGIERIEAQLDLLKSDMQAFKAANPTCALEDFIRWHSPKDLVQDEDSGSWELSERMQLADNTWIRCWTEAKPIPVVNQTRLFNESKLAEEILCWLESANVRMMSELLQPICFTNAVRYLFENATPIESLVEVNKICNALVRCTRTTERYDYLDALREIKIIEKIYLYYKEMYNKLDLPQMSELLPSPPSPDELSSFVTALVADYIKHRDTTNVVTRGIPIAGAATGPIGGAVRRMIRNRDDYDEKKELPKPTRRQYTMRWLVPRPLAHSRLMPQRLFASIEDEEFRLNGSFSEDAVFH